jgi:hypothetical protein
MSQLTKALMDGGSGLNVIHLDTFEGFGLGQNLRPARTHSTEWF